MKLNLKHRVLSIVLALIMVLSIAPVAIFAEETGNGDAANTTNSSDTTNGVTVVGINGFEGRQFASFEEAYESIKPEVEKLGLNQEGAKADAFDALFTDVDTNGDATLTFKITGNVAYDETNCANLLTMGRKASHFGNDRHLINFKFVGTSENRGATLSVNSGITLPYEWWGEKKTTSISFENLTITGTAANGLYPSQAYFEGIDFKVDNCTLKGIRIYNCSNVGGSYTITNSTLDGEGTASGAYAIHFQGNETEPLNITISGNTISGYDRGINIDQKTANATIAENKISIKDANRSCIQLTQLAETEISGNELALNGGNAFTLHENLAAGSKIAIKGNTVTGTGYLVYDAAKNAIDLTFGADNTIADTVDKTKGIYKGATTDVSEAVSAVISAAVAGGETAVAKVNGKGYATLAEAIAAAKPDANGVITYEIYGKAKIDSDDKSWIQVLPAGLEGVKAVKFVGKTADAEISITNSTSVLADQNYDIDVSFENLTLSHPNGAWADDFGHSTNYFTCWLRNTGAAENTVTYTNCTFPDGACNNQYGKTVFDGCKFTNETSGKYNLWNYGGETVVKDSAFTGTRGIKTYNEGAASQTIEIVKTTFDGITEKAAIVSSKPTSITLTGVSVTDCAKGLLQKDLGTGVTIEANGSNISGTFDVTADKTAAEGFNISGGTFTSEVDSAYLAEGFTITESTDAEGNKTYGVEAKADYAAKIGGTGYATLAEAIAAAKDGETVILFADVELTEAISIGKTVTLDLNGKTISSSTLTAMFTISDGGDLTVKDTSEGAVGRIISTQSTWGEVIQMSGGSFTLLSGTIASETSNSINGGTIVLSSGDPIVHIKGGVVERTGSGSAIRSVSANSTEGDNAVIVSGGMVTGKNAYGIYSMYSGGVLISGGTVSGNGDAVLYLCNWSSCVTITGGTVKNTNTNGNTVTVKAKKSLTITGGSVGKVNIDSATASLTVGAENGKASDLTIDAIDFNSNATATKLHSGTIGTITNYNNIKVGTVGSGADKLLLGMDISSVIKGFGTCVKDEASGKWTVTTEKVYFAEIGDTQYESLADAITAAQSGNTIKLLRDITVTSFIEIANGKDFILDLNGYTLTGNKTVVIRNDGTLTVNDSSTGKTGAIKAVGSGNGINNLGTLTINGGSITSGNTSNSAVLVGTNSVTTINGGTFSNGNSLGFNSSIENVTVTVNGGKFVNTVNFSNIKAGNTINIKGGTFEGITNLPSEKSVLTVSGGTFNKDMSDYCMDGFGTVADSTEKKYVYKRTKAPSSYVEDASGNVTISDEEGLFWFAEQVNEAGNTFEGKTVTLANDITLTKAWTPVGVSTTKFFEGTFDGAGYTITGLDVDGAYQGYGYGFFKTVISATVKNVTFEKADVTGAYSNIVGIVVGYSYGSSVYENVHVNDSTVYAFGKVGGIVGYAEDRGATTTFRNCSVTNSTIHGGYNTAGFLGLAQGKCSISGSYLANNTVTIDEDSQGFGTLTELDTTVTCDGSVGTCAGHGTVIKGKYLPNGGYYWSAWADLYNHYGDSSHDCTLANGKMLANSEVVHNAPVAIGDVLYSDLQAAFDAAKTGDTVTLLDDITLTEQVNITKALNGLTLDGNGKTIHCATTTDPSQNGGSALYFGHNAQKLYCTGIKIKDLNMDGKARFAIFLCGGTTTEFTNVNISGSYLYAINLYGTHGATMTNCTISNDLNLGTENEGGASIWSNVASANPLKLINSNVGIIGINKYTDANKLEPKIFIDKNSSAEIHTLDDGDVSGNKKLCVSTESEGTYTIKEYDSTNDTWVEVKDYVAAIGDVKYETLKDAIAAAKDGETVKLLADVTVDAQITVNAKITLDLNDKTVTSTWAMASGAGGEARYALLLKADVTVQNGTFAAGKARAIGAYGALTLDRVNVSTQLTDGNACVALCANGKTYTISNTDINGAYALAIFANNATVNVSDSTLTGNGEVLYHNGSNYGLILTVTDTTITGTGNGCGAYISGSIDAQNNADNQNGKGGYNKATFTGCTISGANGVEVKYTDLTLDNCIVSTTVGTPSYTQNNNGPATKGFAVVSTDNAVKQATPKPAGSITIKGDGKFTGPVGLGSLASVKETYKDFEDKTIAISGGTFSHEIPKDYCAEGFMPKANADGTYGVIAALKGTKENPYTLEEFGKMTRAEYIAAQEALGGTMYVDVGAYSYYKYGTLGNGERNDTVGQIPDHSKLNAYGENGYLGDKNDGANGKNVVFVGSSITSGITGYTDIDNIGTYLLLAVPAYTNVTFEGITFNNVMNFNYQLYTSPWSQLGSIEFKKCTFNGIIVGSIAAQTLAFRGCEFKSYTNTVSANNSNPTWIRPAYGNWAKDDNEGQGGNFKSLTTIIFEDNTVTSTRPVKFECIAQWEMDTKVTVKGNNFDIKDDGSNKNVGMYFGANAKFDLVADNNTKSDSTAVLYTAVYSAPNGSSYAGLPAGSTVKNASGDDVTLDANEWKTTNKLTLKTTTEAVELINSKNVSVKFATLTEAIAAANDGETVKLLADVDLDAQIAISKAITIDGQSKYTIKATKKLVSTTNKFGMFYRTTSAQGTLTFLNVTLDGNGVSKIFLNEGGAGETVFDGVTSKNGGGIAYGSGIHISGGGSHATIKNSTLTGSTGTMELSAENYYAANDLWVGGNVYVTVENSTIGYVFVNSAPSATAANNVVHGQLTIKGENTKITYISGDEDAKAVDKFGNNGSMIKIEAGTVDTLFDKGVYSISGGTFSHEIPKDYCAEGFMPKANADGTYGVVKSITVKISSDPKNAGLLSGGGAYASGSEVTVKATATRGYEFDGWYLTDGTKVSSKAIYTFEPTANIELVAKFKGNEKKTLTVTPTNGGTVSATFDGTTKTWSTAAVGDYKIGTTFELTANATDGYGFLCWVNSDWRVVSDEATYSITIGDNTSVMAIFFKKSGDANLGYFVSFRDRSGKIMSTTQTDADGRVKVPAVGYYYGAKFIGWADSKNNLFEVDNDGMITVTGDMTVYAKYEVTTGFKVKVNGKDLDKTYAYGDKVELNADAQITEGDAIKKFAGWYIGDKLISQSTNYTLVVTGDVELEAKYDETGIVTDKPIINIDGTRTGDSSEQEFVTIITWSLPGNYKVIEGGFLRTLFAQCGNAESLTIDSVDDSAIVKKTSVKKNSVNTYVFTLNITGKFALSSSIYERGYLIYEDGEGVQHTIYTDVVEFTPASGN